MAKKREEWTGPDAALMNDEDFAKIQANSDAWFAAQARGDQAAMDALHDDSERIRSKYNYSGGDAGIEYNKLSDGESTYSFASNENRPSYSSQYAEDIRALTNMAAPEYTSQYDGQLAALMGQSAPEYQGSRYAGQIEALSGRQAPTYTSRYSGDLEALRGQSAPAYESKYGAELEAATRALLEHDPFSYDPETDPLYASYRKEYAREGQRAAADTLGQYAAMTGGMPSTTAVTASQQAGNYYAAKMADALPQLYQAAYQRYQNEGNDQVRNINALRQLEDTEYARYVNDVNQFNTDRNFDYALLSQLENSDYNRYVNDVNQFNADRAFDYSVLNQLDQNDRNDYLTRLNQWNTDRSFNAGVLSQLEQNEYNRYLNELGQFNTDRAFDYTALNQMESNAYGQYQDALNQWNNDRAFEYGQQRDALADQRYADETAYDRALTDYQLAYQRDRDALSDAMNRAQLGAAYGDYSGLSELGITPDAAALLQMELAGSGRTVPIGSGGGGRGGSSGSGGSSGNSGGGTQQKSVTADNKSSLDYDPDEGIFTWNGKRFNSVESLQKSLNASSLTDEQVRSLKRALRSYGFDA